ncbi:DNA-binding CsgD family transcriptional regulator [Brevundimonas alba]|uniref:DNA-binding CsgD family transcriptional regulator n=1 Tax=Brevundimonas alba TaxID=74314 RepID=A0A7X6BN20_9CAUL|nr:helix-turn-helix transcriptional regulator [Brevundimonas alba]NJC41693.1 DNA-binding CsgD family transcriptional regulator [Brevundimonas alba]
MDYDHQILWANDNFRALDRRSVLRVHDGALAFSDRNRQSDFGAFVGQLGDVASAWILDKAEGAFLLLRCARLVPEGHAPAVACVVYDSQDRAGAVWGDFGPRFGLTAAEAVLARRLADGELLADLASSLSITQETAKTHLRRIYAKLGVGSREEFYAHLLPFRIS